MPTWLTSTSQCASEPDKYCYNTELDRDGVGCRVLFFSNCGGEMVCSHCPIQAAIRLLTPSLDEKLLVAEKQTFI